MRPEGSEGPSCGCDGWLRGWGGWVGYYIFYPLSFILLGMCDYIIKNISLFGFTVIAVYIVDQFIERASFFFL